MPEESQNRYSTAINRRIFLDEISHTEKESQGLDQTKGIAASKNPFIHETA
jgi:hypothetical protein